MAFDFPASPTVGQVYSPTGGPIFVFNGTGWTANPQPVVGWRPLSRIKLAADVAFASFAIPLGMSTIRIQGSYKAPSGQSLGLQYSIDGAASWRTDYAYSQVFYANAVGGVSANATYMAITSTNEPAPFYRTVVDGVFSLPTLTERGAGVAQIAYYDNTVFLSSLARSYITGFWAALATHGRLVPTSGNLGAGTDIVIEGLY